MTNMEMQVFAHTGSVAQIGERIRQLEAEIQALKNLRASMQTQGSGGFGNALNHSPSQLGQQSPFSSPYSLTHIGKPSDE